MNRTGRVIALSLEAVVLVVLIAGAAFASMGRILVANIDTFESRIERRLSADLNVPVTVGSIEGAWDYLDPTITIRDLRIGAGSDGAAIEVGLASARLHSIASAREQAIVVSELQLDGIGAELTQDDAGRWRISGMPEGDGGFNMDPIMTSLAWIKAVDVRGVDVTVVGQRRTYNLTSQSDKPMELVENEGRRILSMPLSFERAPEQFSEFELVGHYQGDPRRVETFTADLYLRLPRLELADFLPRFGAIRVEKSFVHGQFWLESREGNWNLRALPVLESLVLDRDDASVEIASDVAIRMVASGEALHNLQFDVDSLDGMVAGERWQLEQLSIALLGGKEQWHIGVNLPALDAGRASERLRRVGEQLGLLNAEALTAIDNLNPRGSLADTYLSIDIGGEETDFRLATRLIDFSLDSHRKSPIVAGLDGILVTGPAGGHVDLTGDDFSIGFPGAFDRVWDFDRGRGRLAFDVADGYPKISSRLLRLWQGPMTATGRLHINLPAERVDRNWGLEIGIMDAQLPAAHPFVPETVGPELKDWLKRAVKAGTAQRAGMVFHGTLDQSAPPNSKAFDLYFDVEQAELDYDAAWPPVEQLGATIHVSNYGVRSDGATGTMLGNRVETDVRVPMSASSPPDAILIDGEIDGELASGLKVLQETPLAAETNGLAETWTGTGDYRGTVSLDVPIGPRAGVPVGADVSITLDGNDVVMGDLDLEISDLRSVMRYETGEGLSTSSFDARLFDYPVKGSITSEATGTGGAVQLNLGGRVAVSRLRQWSDQELLRAADGSFDYEATLHVPFGDRAKELAYVEARSTLEGVIVDLPPPVGKMPNETRDFTFRQSFLDKGFRINIDLDGITRVSVKTVADSLVGGRVHFGTSPMGVVTYDDFAVTGQLDHVVFERWREASRYLETETGQPTELAGTLESIDVRIASLMAFEIELDDVRTFVTREPGQWNVRLTNALVGGLFEVPDIDAPITIALDYIRYESEGGEAESDPLGATDPRAFSAIDFSVAELTIDGDSFGSWEFDFRPNERGAVLDNLAADVKGLSLKAESDVVWDVTGDAPVSRFIGPIKVADLSSAFKQWGFASSVEGENLELLADFGWDGSPLMIDLYEVDGTVEILGGSGRFVQAESGTGALRLLGIFDFASLARRFRFDFSDVVNKGFSFSELSGKVRLDDGVVSVVDPILIVGSGSKFKVGGTVDLETSELDNDMIVTLPVSRNLPWYAAYSAIATGPLVGAGVWLAQKVFENQIDQMSSAKYRIEGTIDQPQIEFVSIFSDSVREVAPDQPKQKPPETDGTARVEQAPDPAVASTGAGNVP